ARQHAKGDCVMNKLLLIAASVAGLALVGCEEKKGSTESAADKITEATKSAGDAVKDGAHKAAEATKDAADAAKDAAAKGVDAAKGAWEDARNWVSETVDKQWPQAKASLDELAAKASAMTDGELKTKANTLVEELKAKVPSMEQIVADLKAGKGEVEKLLAD